MSVKKIVRAVCALTISAAACAIPMLSGCAIKTSHPEAKITITFDGEDYVLKYKMYRNMYPQTVQHFIELADSGFYNNTIIHDYKSSYWYGGGYSYNTTTADGEETSYTDARKQNTMASYLEDNSKEAIYKQLFTEGKLTASVYKSYVNGTYTDALPTLLGEFTNNKHSIDNGALKSAYGCLRMYYTSSDTDEVVYLKKQGNESKQLLGQYKYNRATSLFSLQVSTTEASDSSYCIFAKLKDTTILDDLRTAISDYISNSDSYSTLTFTSSCSLYVDNYDEIIGQRVNSVTYTQTAEPIIIKSVKITKY
jgi:cyclophilin family peptidyl-prolyl cis-trans isomerase